MKKFTLHVIFCFCSVTLFAQTVSTFDNLTLATDTFWNGSDLSGGFSSGNAFFRNSYDTTYAVWDGFAYSDKTDSVTGGYDHPYSAIAAQGYGGSANYAIAYTSDFSPATIALTGNAAGKLVKGFYITNTTYAYLSMRDGDAFAKKFGGASGNDADWFKLRVLGWWNGALKQSFVDFYLADYRFANNAQDYIVKDWTWVDLQPLGEVDSIMFQLTSSDTGQFGMNTPSYFAMDNFSTADAANEAPIANNDAATVTYLQTAIVNVLANDIDSTATPLTVSIIDSGRIPGSTTWVDSLSNVVYTPAIGIVANDTVTYRVCDELNACATAQVFIYVQPINGIDEVTANKLIVYPNPFNDVISVKSDADIQSMAVYDMQGKCLLYNNAENGNTNSLQTVNLTTGVYFLKVVTGDGSSVNVITKQ